MPRIGIRDQEYIENRLGIPHDVTEAIGRMKQVGEYEVAQELMEVVQEFGDQLRQIRAQFRHKVGRY